jgi:hypothetical protein
VSGLAAIGLSVDSLDLAGMAGTAHVAGIGPVSAIMIAASVPAEPFSGTQMIGTGTVLADI